MSITSRFTYLPDGFTFELVEYDDGSREYNLVPRAPQEGSSSAPVLDTVEDDMTLTAAPLEPREPVTEKKSVGRNVAAFIRGMWTFLIAVFVEGGTYLVNNLTSLHIPQGYAVMGGAALQGAIYATKKRAFPDTTL